MIERDGDRIATRDAIAPPAPAWAAQASTSNRSRATDVGRLSRAVDVLNYFRLMEIDRAPDEHQLEAGNFEILLNK